jgi:hypothetical protein
MKNATSPNWSSRLVARMCPTSAHDLQKMLGSQNCVSSLTGTLRFRRTSGRTQNYLLQLTASRGRAHHAFSSKGDLHPDRSAGLSEESGTFPVVIRNSTYFQISVRRSKSSAISSGWREKVSSFQLSWSSYEDRPISSQAHWSDPKRKFALSFRGSLRRTWRILRSAKQLYWQWTRR